MDGHARAAGRKQDRSVLRSAGLWRPGAAGHPTAKWPLHRFVRKTRAKRGYLKIASSFADPSYDYVIDSQERSARPGCKRPGHRTTLNGLTVPSGYDFAIEFNEELPLRPLRVIEVFTERSPASMRQAVQSTVRFGIN